MQISVENTGKLERRMQVQVPAEKVNQEIASRLKELSRTARLNGFRPGKAPLNVILSLIHISMAPATAKSTAVSPRLPPSVFGANSSELAIDD